MKRWFGCVSATAALAVLGFVSPVSADVILDTGGGNFPGDDNVIFQNCNGNITGPANLIQGCLNSNHDTLVNFTSQDTIQANGGQARIEGVPTFDDLGIAFADANLGFTTLIFNVNAVNGDDGQITITVNLLNEPDVVFTAQNVSGAGSNFFRLSTINGEIIESVNIQSSVSVAVLFDDVRQIRIGSTELPTAVPEPTSMTLLGLGLVGVTMRRWRKRDS